MSILQSGEENTQYGTMWIYNPVLKNEKNILEKYQTGWFRGRINNWDRFLINLWKKKKGYLLKKKKKLRNIKYIIPIYMKYM